MKYIELAEIKLLRFYVKHRKALWAVDAFLRKNKSFVLLMLKALFCGLLLLIIPDVVKAIMTSGSPADLRTGLAVAYVVIPAFIAGIYTVSTLWRTVRRVWNGAPWMLSYAEMITKYGVMAITLVIIYAFVPVLGYALSVDLSNSIYWVGVPSYQAGLAYGFVAMAAIQFFRTVVIWEERTERGRRRWPLSA